MNGAKAFNNETSVLHRRYILCIYESNTASEQATAGLRAASYTLERRRGIGLASYVHRCAPVSKRLHHLQTRLLTSTSPKPCRDELGSRAVGKAGSAYLSVPFGATLMTENRNARCAAPRRGAPLGLPSLIEQRSEKERKATEKSGRHDGGFRQKSTWTQRHPARAVSATKRRR